MSAPPGTPFLKAVIGTNAPERQEVPKSRLDYLYDRRNWLTRRVRRAQARLTVSVVAGLVFLVVAALALAGDSDVVAGVAGGLAAVGVCTVLLLAQRVRNLNGDLEVALKEISLREGAKESSDAQAKAEVTVAVSQINLKRYHDQIRDQGKVIFWVGVFCIFVGFAIVIAAIPYVASNRELSDKIVVAALSAVGGVLANFVAAIYLRMFTETLKTVGQFHTRMVGTHNLYFADYLATKTQGAAQSEAFAHMAQALAESAAAPPEDNGTGAAPAPAKRS